jgi:hypothetical protein
MVVGYLDASSGSMVVGAIAAGGAAVAVAAKVGWRRVTGVFGKDKDVEASDADVDVDADADADIAAPVTEAAVDPDVSAATSDTDA